MTSSLRIGAVSYLNTKPLVYGLAEQLPDAEIVLDHPSRLADALTAGDLDIALVPSAELLLHPRWTVVSDACIACDGPVLSVKLLFRVPPRQVRTLALDEGSRTSALLSQVLLRELVGVQPELSVLEIGKEVSDVAADAVLLIGDRAIYNRADEFVEVWDLGDRWCRWAELPFVFAMWTARPEVDATVAASAFSAARDAGCAHLDKIAQHESSAMGLPFELVLEYLSRNLHFTLAERERRGLEMFYRKVRACRLCPASV